MTGPADTIPSPTSLPLLSEQQRTAAAGVSHGIHAARAPGIKSGGPSLILSTLMHLKTS